ALGLAQLGIHRHNTDRGVECARGPGRKLPHSARPVLHSELSGQLLIRGIGFPGVATHRLTPCVHRSQRTDGEAVHVFTGSTDPTLEGADRGPRAGTNVPACHRTSLRRGTRVVTEVRVRSV